MESARTWNITGLWVRFLAVSDIIISHVQPTITCMGPFGVLWVHMVWRKIGLKTHVDDKHYNDVDCLTSGRVKGCSVSTWHLSRCHKICCSWSWRAWTCCDSSSESLIDDVASVHDDAQAAAAAASVAAFHPSPRLLLPPPVRCSYLSTPSCGGNIKIFRIQRYYK